MSGKRPGDSSRRLRLSIPERGHVVVVGRTAEACEPLVALVSPRVQSKGGSLRVFSQLHQLEELAGARVDVLILDPSLGPIAREAVVWVARRSNTNVIVIEISA